MTPLGDASVPRLALGCRLNPAGGSEDLLLIPEGALRLHGPARSILELCDGARTVAAITALVQEGYPAEVAPAVAGDIAALLQRLCERGVLETS